MRGLDALSLGLAIIVCVLAPNRLVADYHDNFDDGSFWQGVAPNDSIFQPPTLPDPGFDPNLWEIDDPHWSFFTAVSENPLAEIIESDVVHRAVRLYCEATYFFPTDAMIAGYVNDQDRDANTSTAWWGDTGNFYLLCKGYNTDALLDDPNDPNGQDPNLDKGSFNLVILADDAVWTGYRFGVDLHNKAYPNSPWSPSEWYTTFTAIFAGSGTDWPQIQRTNLDPNDPNWADIDMWERTGMWMLCQFESDGVAGDPNGKFIRTAIWGGDKFDWDGTWVLEIELNGNGWVTGGMDPLEWYASVGGMAVAAWPSRDWSNGFPGDVGYDDFEARTGNFTNVSRTLTIKMKDCCDLDICPDRLDDPNHDANDLDELRRYTRGTLLMLDAVVPCGSKAFKKWTVKGPNQSDDPNYQVVMDTNEVLYLAMDGDYLVKATCKCGGGGMAPFAGMALVLLALGAAIRRLA